MTPEDYDFEKVSLKTDVAQQINQIIEDCRKYGIIITKSDLLRIMLNDGHIIEYTIKKIVYDKNKQKAGL